MVQETRESVEHTQSPSENTQEPQSQSSRRKSALLPWFIAISGFLTAVAAVLTSIGAPEFFLELAKSIGLKSSQEESQIEPPKQTELIKVEFIVQGENKQPVEGVKVRFTSSGAPEPRLTDSEGYVDIRIPARDDIDIVLTKEGFETITRTINTAVDIENIRTITLKESPLPPASNTDPVEPILFPPPPVSSQPPSSSEIENTKPFSKNNEQIKHQVTTPTKTQENKNLFKPVKPSSFEGSLLERFESNKR